MASKAQINLNVKVQLNKAQNMKKFWMKYGRQICDEINERLAKIQYDKAKQLSKEAIDMFYGSYGPNLYQRTGSLYDIFDIEITGDNGFRFSITSDLMGWHRSNEAVFQIDFIEGYHGGRKWRTPPTIDGQTWGNHPIIGRFVKIEGGDYAFATHSWEYWHWKPAVKTESPFVYLLKRWNAFIDGEYESLKQSIVNEVIGMYVGMFDWR